MRTLLFFLAALPCLPFYFLRQELLASLSAFVFRGKNLNET